MLCTDLFSDWCIHQVAPTIKERMVKAGSMLIGYQPLGDKVNFFRLVIANLSLELTDMDFIVNEIDTLGKDICFWKIKLICTLTYIYYI